LGFGFLIYTAVEWNKLIHLGLTINSNLFGSTYYSLVGLHASHVVVGLILIGLILVMNLTGRIRRFHHEHIMMISWYWHFVDAVWIVVFTVVYVISAKS
jgi:cytochrome c oxidase subunit 3/cytochrome o ubiquinol oxidase subunit 3